MYNMRYIHCGGCFWIMIDARKLAACGVFEGNVVVCGGWNNNFNFAKLNRLPTVESYDVTADEWSPMPDMIHGKSEHKLIVVRNKMIVMGMGRDNCEIFDSNCKMFVAFKSPQMYLNGLNKIVSIGNNIYVFLTVSTDLNKSETFVLRYDIDKGKWSIPDVQFNTKDFSCVKVPLL